MIDKRAYRTIIHFKDVNDITVEGYTNWLITEDERLIPYTSKEAVDGFIPFNRLIHLKKNPDVDMEVVRKINPFSI